jgi:hypothetical protein
MVLIGEVDPPLPADATRYRSSETVSRLRPLALRRLSTALPFCVAIRVRNPCVRRRRRLLGWNVLTAFGIDESPRNL